MDKRQLVIESIKKLLSLNVSDSEIMENLSDVGLSKEEAIELIKEAKEINTSSIKKEDVQQENIVNENQTNFKTKSSSKEVFDDTVKKLSMNDQVISQIPFVKKNHKGVSTQELESTQESSEKMVGDVANQSLKINGNEIKETSVLSEGTKTNSDNAKKDDLLNKKPVSSASSEGVIDFEESSKRVLDSVNQSSSKEIDAKSLPNKNDFSSINLDNSYPKKSASINFSENKSNLEKSSDKSSINFGIKNNQEEYSEKSFYSKNDFVKPSTGFEELWKKGIVVAVNTKLAEMKQLKEEVDLKINQSVDEALRKELYQMKVLMDSQKELLISSNKEVLEQKQKEITFIIDSKIAELKQYNKHLLENLKLMDEIKKQQQESIIGIKSALEDAKKTKAQLLIEVNSEMIKTKSQAQAFLDSASNQLNQMDVRVNKTLELEKNIAEGMLSQAEQKIEQIAITRADELIGKLEVELNKLQATNKRISPELLDDKIKTLEKFRVEFIDNMQKSLSQINSSIEELNKKNEFAQKTLEEKTLAIDAKMEELTKFEKQFTQIMENVLSKSN